MLFVDDIVILEESRDKLNGRLKTRKLALETYEFHLNRRKTEYMYCNFSKRKCVSSVEVKVEDHIIPHVTRFKYVGFKMKEN
jgi:hypothetical protein